MSAKHPSELNRILRQGIEAATRGQSAQARKYFIAVLKQDPDNIPAMLWLAFVLPSPRDAVRVLERVLVLDPANERAQAGIRWARDRLKAEAATNATAAPPSPPDDDTTSLDEAAIRRQLLSKKLQQQGRKGVLAHRARRNIRPLTIILVIASLLALLLAGLGMLSLVPPDTLAAWLPSRPVAVDPPPADLSEAAVEKPPLAGATSSALVTLSDTLALPAATAPPALPAATPLPAPTEPPPALDLPPVLPVPDLALFVGPELPIAEPTAMPTENLLLAHQPAYPDEKWIEVNLTTQQVTAWEGDKPVFSFLASTGLPQTPTVVGEYRIYWKLKSTLMTGPGYYLPDVPYTMYFYRGYALHGTYWHNNFGQPMSHGCVNLETENARKLFEWADPVVPEGQTQVVATADNPGTLVVVHY